MCVSLYTPPSMWYIKWGINGCTMVAKFLKTPNNPWNIRNTYTISSTKRKTTLQNTVLIKVYPMSRTFSFLFFKNLDTEF